MLVVEAHGIACTKPQRVKRQLRPREVKQLAQDHTVHLQKRQELSSVSYKCVSCF